MFYCTSDPQELDNIKKILIYGQKIRYQGKYYTLVYFFDFPIQIDNDNPKYYGICILVDENNTYIKLPYKEVCKIIQNK